MTTGPTGMRAMSGEEAHNFFEAFDWPSATLDDLRRIWEAHPEDHACWTALAAEITRRAVEFEEAKIEALRASLADAYTMIEAVRVAVARPSAPPSTENNP